ncbi:MAG TPA: hypothetical protein P5137_16935, partial [Candidatus Brocadiia bacterium]|nr:hypothetical protein [Candidatus Brocadiia bacterium]
MEPLASVYTTLIAVFFLGQPVSLASAACVAVLLAGTFIVIAGNMTRRAAALPVLGEGKPSR